MFNPWPAYFQLAQTAWDANVVVAMRLMRLAAGGALAQREGVDMPIVEAAHQILYEGRPPIEAVVALMTRAPRAERD